MKNDLIQLIEEVDHIEGLFRRFEPEIGLSIPSGDFIYDVPEFIEWKQAILYELQDIYDRTHDAFVWKIINATGVISRFTGRNYDDRKNFSELKGALRVIRKNIDRYYPENTANLEKEGCEKMKKTKVFISHSSKDIKQVSLLVDLLADMGLTNDDLFCSSVPDYSIPLNADIYDYLASLFRDCNIYVIFMLSHNYYQSPVCLNEMGAAWVLKNDYTSILLHGFDYHEVKGAVNPNKIGLRFDDSDELLKKRLGELITILSERLGKSIPDMRWERKRDSFVSEIKNLV